jgi:hypothetical protein
LIFKLNNPNLTVFSRSHALAWERILDAPASKLNENFHFSFLSVMMNWTLARPDCIPTLARGNEKTLPNLKDSIRGSSFFIEKT